MTMVINPNQHQHFIELIELYLHLPVWKRLAALFTLEWFVGGV